MGSAANPARPGFPRDLPVWLVILLRVPVIGFFLLTSAYAVLNCSPFAFDMFIRPQLFPWLGRFVAWHHVWNAAAYLVSVVTLLPELTWSVSGCWWRTAARWLAIAYTVLFGIVTLLLVANPYLPTLWNDARALPTAVAALIPVMVLAAIDHLRAASRARSDDVNGAATLGPSRLLVACGGAAGYLWLAHFVRALVHEDLSGGTAVWVLTGLRTLSLTAAFFALVYAVFSLFAVFAAHTRAPRTWEYGLTGAALAIGLCEFLRRAVLRTISIDESTSLILGATVGVTLAFAWSGLALRRPVARPAGGWTGTEVLIAPAFSQATTIVALVLLPILSFAALSSIERLDWSFGARRTILIVEMIAAFGLMLRATHRAPVRAWSPRWIAIPPLATLLVFLAFPAAASGLAAWTGNRHLEPAIAFYRHAAAEAGFKVLAETLVARPALDDDYQQFLLEHADFSGKTSITVPEIDFAAPVAVTDVRRSRPDVFVLVIDSLRRDYLSPYNPQVTFTPHIGAFAAESFAFQNAFTRHGGTELAMPSIWAGAPVVRKVRSHAFDRMNALEKLVNLDGYRMAINDFTVAEHLRKDTPKTTIDEGVASVDTDLCSNLRSLEGYLDQTSGDARPVFGYFAPMNVHILNTRRGGQTSLDGDYPGFYAPYASRLKRIDACFGAFVAYLKARQRYDDSIIVLTSDHGDSLGEDGYWGHAMWLFPEDVRVPLIVHVPASVKAHVTTDLARLSFSTDIAPTLYTLLGHPIRDLGPLFGDTLFVSPDCHLSDRRLKSYLLTSSYGATYGVLRRNGRLLYVSDLVEWAESAYELAREGTATPLATDREIRRVNQRLIREHVTEMAAFYRFSR